MRSKRFFSIVAMTIFLGATYAVAPVAEAGSGDNPCWGYRIAEKGFARRINSERVERNLGKLSLDPELSKAARVHTREMVRREELYHTPSDKLRNRVTNWIVLGENVGVGGSVSSLHDAFMASPAHRDNVLHAAYQHVGIGTKKADGRLWVTVIFEAVTDPGTTLRMPRCK
ncbi:MAG TPA: CAP domain-containing protein [Actinomycetota bacterium]|nr:CAP domain-containing protein [Actinomycetota bacterium]